jgi:hypothetical protein
LITDKLATFSDDQSLVAAAGNILGDKSIDMWAGQTALPTDTLGNTTFRDLGRGTPVEVIGTVNTSFTSTSSDGTVKMQLVHADDEALGTNLVVLAETAAKVCPAKGTIFRLVPPPGTTKRFVGVRWVTAVHDPTAGKVSAFLVPLGSVGDALVV